MAETRKFVPLNEANTDRVRLSLSLPSYVDSDKIGINQKGIHTLIWIGGIKELNVVGSRSNERTGYETTIVGSDAKGEALAGRIVKKEIPIFKANCADDGDPRLIHPERWAKATIEINTNEISERIAQGDEPAGSPATWSKHIDNSLKNGIIKAGTHHLLKDLERQDIFDTAIVYSIGGYTYIKYSLLGQPLLAIVGFFGWNVWYNLTNYIKGHPYLNKYKDEHATEGFRVSLFTGPQFDRAAALYVAGKAKTLVKEVS